MAGRQALAGVPIALVVEALAERDLNDATRM